MQIIPYVTFVPLMLFSILKAVRRKPEWMALLLIASGATISLVRVFLNLSVFTIFWIGSFEFHVEDIVLIFLFVYCCIWLVKSPHFTKPLVLFIALILLPLAISAVRGLLIGSFSTSSFISDVRMYGFYVLPIFALYIFVRDKNLADFAKSMVYIHRFMNCMAAFLISIWCLDLFFGVNTLPGQLDGVLSDGGSTFRIIPKPVNAFMALYVYLLAYQDFRKGKALGWKTVFFSILVLLVQWRGVQLSFIIGCFLLLLLKVIQDKRISARLAVQTSAILLVFFIAPVLFGRTALLSSMISSVFTGRAPKTISISASEFALESASESGSASTPAADGAASLARATNTPGTYATVAPLSDSVEDAMASFTSVANNTGTYATRTHVWEMIISSLSGIDRLIGQPFGTPYAPSVTWPHSPHSQYVDVIYKEGFFGLACFLVFFLGSIAVAVRRRQWLVAICLVFFMIYFYSIETGIIESAAVGVCLGVLEWSRRDRLDSKESYGMD
jgi:hypothetical protein